MVTYIQILNFWTSLVYSNKNPPANEETQVHP